MIAYVIGNPSISKGLQHGRPTIENYGNQDGNMVRNKKVDATIARALMHLISSVAKEGEASHGKKYYGRKP